MSVTTTAPPSPDPKADAARCCWCRLGIFAFNLVVVLGLVVIGVLYARHPEHFRLLISDKVEIAVRAAWFGALGGVVISLKGVYDHCCDRGDWDDCFNLWHLGRPVSGALAGMITLLLLLVVSADGKVSEPAVYAAAFIFGTQERRFFNFLSEVAGLVVRVPSEDQKLAFKAKSIEPAQGAAGSIVLISGQGFAQGAKVTFGTAELANVIVSKDGMTIVGTVPSGTGAVDVTVTNPAGERSILPGKFTYRT